MPKPARATRLILSVIACLIVGGLGRAHAQAVADEFLIQRSADTYAASIVRLNLQLDSSGPLNWISGHTRTGVVVGPGTVLTTLDLIGEGVRTGERLRLVVGDRSLEAFVVYADPGDGLLLLGVQDLRLDARPVALGGLGAATPLYGFGHAFRLTSINGAGDRVWQVDPTWREGRLGGAPVGEDILAAGLVLTDACGRVVGFRTGVREREPFLSSSSINLAAVRRFVRGSGFKVVEQGGWCVDPKLAETVRTARAETIAEDRRTAASWRKAREEARIAAGRDRTGRFGLVGAGAAIGLIGAVLVAAGGAPIGASPRRRLGRVLAFAGVVVFCGGIALDPVRRWIAGEAEGSSVRLICRAQNGTGASLAFDFDLTQPCLTAGSASFPFQLVSSGGDRLAFQRMARTEEDLKTGAVTVRTFTGDLSGYIETRLAVPVELRSSIDAPFDDPGEVMNRCVDPQAAQAGLTRRRAFVVPHLERMTTLSSDGYVCERVSEPSG